MMDIKTTKDQIIEMLKYIEDPDLLAYLRTLLMIW